MEGWDMEKEDSKGSTINQMDCSVESDGGETELAEAIASLIYQLRVLGPLD